MTTRRMVSVLFVVAAIYDGVLGVAFLFAGNALYRWFDVPPPNHPGYIQFPALLLLVFAVMFLAIATDPLKNRNLIPYGAMLKVAYCGVVSYHWITTDLPGMWKPFCIADFAFLILFVWAWSALAKVRARPGTP